MTRQPFATRSRVFVSIHDNLRNTGTSHLIVNCSQEPLNPLHVTIEAIIQCVQFLYGKEILGKNFVEIKLNAYGQGKLIPYLGHLISFLPDTRNHIFVHSSLASLDVIINLYFHLYHTLEFIKLVFGIIW
jgi:hypothetical protein